MSEKRYKKGDWTNCRYDICEILKDDEVFCTVATNDVELIIGVLNANDELCEHNKRMRRKVSRLYKDRYKLWELCKEQGMTEEEIERELER